MLQIERASCFTPLSEQRNLIVTVNIRNELDTQLVHAAECITKVRVNVPYKLTHEMAEAWNSKRCFQTCKYSWCPAIKQLVHHVTGCREREGKCTTRESKP